ncbi:hypothetical protein BG011_001451 [Mortierella polycephala]|uniref:Zn(2)-C6 fungal-type domain-containing protein n=1 Tax=Mortierella polycephala TaxID=41804 RepID=A0A9P6TV25_9FUNG|nr:hypothetical protein BG011_001451 [Mortierella polycephala]
MNIPPQQQYQEQDQQQQQPSPLLKQESQIKQEPIQLSTSQYQQQNFQPVPPYASQQQQHHGHTQSYNSLQGSPIGALNSYSNPYNLNSHLMGLSMQSGSTSAASLTSSSLAPASVAAGGIGASNISGSTTPAIAYASAPSSPIMNNLQYNPSGNSHYNQNSSSLYHQPTYQQQHQQYSNQHTYSSQQQQQHQHSNQHSVQGLSSSNLTSSFYPTSPPLQHQQQQYQPQQQHGTSTQFNAMPPAPPRQQSQYAPLVPPLSDAQYAQYHQLLGSTFSSAASTPYHSNQSTPYSSMPTSPTLEYQQLADPNMVQKPKRRQVKNACVNCQKACKKCDEGRPCTRCIKYGLTDTCVDSTRKVRKKGVKRGPYKRRIPQTQIGSASASTTPTMRHAVLPNGPAGYMSEPVTALNSPTQSHLLPFTSSAIGSLEFGYGGNAGSSSSSYSFQHPRMENSYVAPYTTSYSGPSLYTAPYGMNDYSNVGGNTNNTNNTNNNSSNLS